IAACLTRFPAMHSRLAWAQAEEIPYPDATFDACYSIGGFNYFQDPEAALREMRRVTRPEGTVVVADERPDLKRFGLGHLIGWKAYDRWWMLRAGLPPDFIDMVFETELNLDHLISRAWPELRRLSIWRSLGYCLVSSVARRSA